MTTAPVAVTASRIEGKTALPSERRLTSLDFFRGVTIAAMILVNNPGDEEAAYWPLRHARWNGWTPTDLVFPFFLFIVGVSLEFSFSARLERGESRRGLLAHALGRAAALFAIGVFLNGFPNHYHPATLRIYGVLQRIAICYLLAAVLALWTDHRGQIAVMIACLAGYWIVMRYVPIPGFGIPVRDVPLLDPDRNLVAWLDRKLLMGHLYEGTRDPEGVISTIPALATILCGSLTGSWLRSRRTAGMKSLGLLLAGTAGLLAGELWSIWFPINKKLWTSSFVLFTAGCALLCLALCYWILDAKRRRGRWTTPALAFGSNSIAVYVFAEVIAHAVDRLQLHRAGGGTRALQQAVYERFFSPLAAPANASLLYSLVFLAMCLAVMWLLYRKRIFLKL